MDRRHFFFVFFQAQDELVAKNDKIEEVSQPDPAKPFEPCESPECHAVVTKRTTGWTDFLAS